MVARIRPWSQGSDAKKIVVEGDWVDVKWRDSFTSAHECILQNGEPGFHLPYHGTLIWTPLASVEFRKINSKYRTNTKLPPSKRLGRAEQSALDTRSVRPPQYNPKCVICRRLPHSEGHAASCVIGQRKRAAKQAKDGIF